MFSPGSRCASDESPRPGFGSRLLFGNFRGFGFDAGMFTARLVLLTAFSLVASWSPAADLQVTDAEMPRVPATAPDKAPGTMQMREGFRLELAASEPMIASPVAIAFDEHGRMFVVQMVDYSERRDERLGSIKLLEDKDGDGRFDTGTLYATNLPWPTAVIPYDGGIFVGASPDILYFKDTNGDGVADVRQVVFTGFGNTTAKLNVQQLLNSFTWGIDNRIHGALGGNSGVITNLLKPDARPLVLRGRDFSFNPRTLEMRSEAGGGQWGISYDDEGNKFICSNSRHIAVEVYDEFPPARNPLASLPPPDASIAVDGPAAEVYRISPDEPWRVIRTKWRVAGLVSGPVEGGGRASGYFTGATGVTIYRGDAFPPEYLGDAFVADCGSNLIHRKKIRRNGLDFIAERAPDELKREFIASRDNWFRPVSMANGPDGALYVVDMYRETIEHPWSLPPELKSRLDLNSGNNRGRIWRIVPEGFKPKPLASLGGLGTTGLIQMLEHPNGWHRDTAARLLFERQDVTRNATLEAMVLESTSTVARVHALHALNNTRWLRPELLREALADTNAMVRRHAVKLAPSVWGMNEEVFRALTADSDPGVRFRLALSQTDWVVLMKLLERDAGEPWIRAAALNGTSLAEAGNFFVGLVGNAEFSTRGGAGEVLAELARMAGAGAPLDRVALGLRLASKARDSLELAGAFAAGLQRRNLTLASVDAKIAGEITTQAQSIAGDMAQEEPARVKAVEYLSTLNDSKSRAAVLDLLGSRTPAGLQSAALAAVARRRDSSITNFITRWDQLAPASRVKAVALLLTRRDGAMILLKAVEQGAVARAEIFPADVQRLTTHVDGGVRNLALSVFRPDTSSRAEVAKRFQPALALSGDGARGHELYQQRCASCHRAGVEGFAVGPDLATAAAGGKEKLLRSLLDPSAEVTAGYAAYAIETKAGDSFLGVMAGETATSVTLKVPNGELQRLARESIATMRASDKSLMPEGLEEGLSPQQVADLLEFVAQAKAAP